MAITTQAGLAAALAGGQQVQYTKTTNRATVQALWTSQFDVAGNPVAGTLGGSSTAAGVVPDDTVAGFPPINSFGAGNTGYIGSINFANGGTGVGGYRHILADCLFKAGAYAFNAAVTLAAQPSYSARLPNTDYKGLQIWFEAVTNFTGNLTLAVTYTNQDGTTGRTTGSIAFGLAPVLGQMRQLPLQSGDTGVQKIESVTGTISTVGTFNILVLRPLWMGKLAASGEDFHGPDKAKLPVIYSTSALFLVTSGDNSAGNASQPDLNINVING